MKLPYLDQTIELHRGEAHQLQHVVGNVCLEVLASFGAEYPMPLKPGLLLALPALVRVATKLGRVAQREFLHVGRPRPKPHKFRLTYDELIAVMLYVLPVATSAREPLGKVHQVSLNLDQFIDFVSK